MISYEPVPSRRSGKNLMIGHEYSFRVMYADTDQMGFVHHSNYVKYCETARWELLRSIGVSYHEIEKAGFLLPVTRQNFQFLKPAHYDEQLMIRTTLVNMKGARVWFSFELYNGDKILINKADVEVAFIRKENLRPCHVPQLVLDAIQNYKEMHMHINF